MNRLVLHSYFRSSAAWRVRIALNLKGAVYAIRPVHLLRDGGEHLSDAYRAINPQARVPSLEIAGEDASENAGEILTQSPAILEWIEETWPDPPLLPAAPLARAHVRAICAIIACDIAPLQNSGTQKWLRQEGGFDDARMQAWLTHWIGSGLAAIEALLARRGEMGRLIGGDAPGLAECCLIPQLFGARRFHVPLAAYPRLLAAEAACASLPAFVDAAPGAQPDAE